MILVDELLRAGEVTASANFCRRMGREAHQGEIGLVIGDEYFAFRDFLEE